MLDFLIFTSRVDGIDQLSIRRADYDYVICADGGVKPADALGIKPDLIIGDFDSAEQPDMENLIRLSAEKDMTDSEAAIDLAVSRGADSITVVGGLGGRFDHTMGNLGMLAKYTGVISSIRIIDGWNRIFIADPGTVTVRKDDYKYLGAAAYGEQVTGLTMRGVAYPLDNYTLTNKTTRCVSNEIVGENAEISFKTGRLLIIQSRDAG